MTVGEIQFIEKMMSHRCAFPLYPSDRSNWHPYGSIVGFCFIKVTHYEADYLQALIKETNHIGGQHPKKSQTIGDAPAIIIIITNMMRVQ